jgi:hypothetical protein
MKWPYNGRGATHCDKVGAAAPVLALVLVLVVAVITVCMVQGLWGAL